MKAQNIIVILLLATAGALPDRMSIDVEIRKGDVYQGKTIPQDFQIMANCSSATNIIKYVLRAETFEDIDLVLSTYENGTRRSHRLHVESDQVTTVRKNLTVTLPRGLSRLVTLAVSALKIESQFVGDITVSVSAEHHCDLTVLRGNYADSPTLYRERRALRNEPKWLSLRETVSTNYLWLSPVQSQYGIEALAIASGVGVGMGHEYLELGPYEDARYVLWIPGMIVAGPITEWDLSGNEGYLTGRTLFRYSARDAAWLCWNYVTGKPAWNGGHIKATVLKYTTAVPGTMPGLLLDVGVVE